MDFTEQMEKEKYQEVTNMIGRRTRKEYEQIGIDRTNLGNLQITDVNEDVFFQAVELKGVEYDIDYDTYSPKKMLSSGKGLAELLLDDALI